MRLIDGNELARLEKARQLWHSETGLCCDQLRRNSMGKQAATGSAGPGWETQFLFGPQGLFRRDLPSREDTLVTRSFEFSQQLYAEGYFAQTLLTLACNSESSRPVRYHIVGPSVE